MRNIIFTLLAIICTFSISQFVFNPLNLYYEIWWLDIPMHILGGALFALLFVNLSTYFKLKLEVKSLLIFVFFVGLVWEVYEYSMYVYFNYDWGGMYDSIKDLFDDMLGASIALYINNKNSK